MKLTKKSVESLPIPKSGQQFVWDSQLAGFGVRLNPSGRTYVVQARVSGVSRRISLGRHGAITAEGARKKAHKELAKMLEGKDPVAEKKREEAFKVTLRQLGDAYIEARRNLKQSSISDINKHVNRSFAAWRDRPIIEITRERVAVKFRELSEKSAAQGNLAMRILRALLNFARASYRPGNKPVIAENPVDILSQTKVWNRVTPRSRRIPLDKIGVAWNVLQNLRTDEFSTPIARAAADIVAFMMLSGARWSEAVNLTWDRVDLEQKTWHLADPKNREPKTFPLSDVAAAILEEKARQKGDSAFVFPSWGKSGHVWDVSPVMVKISTAIGTKVTPHDLRRTFRAVADVCGVDFVKAKLLLGHKFSDVTIAHYTETSDLSYLSGQINAIAQWITTKALEAASEKVLPFPTQAEGA